jgi:hypothetical protein
MASLTDLLTIVINMLFVFTTVSFISSAAADAIAGLFRRRQTLLAQAVAQMLDDKAFDGLALEIYNNPSVNPRVDGAARTRAELTYLPAWIDPAVFATALLEALHIIPSAPVPMPKVQPLTVDETVPEQERIDNAITNATRRIAADGDTRSLICLLTNMIRRCRARRDLMEKSIAQWFDATMQSVTEQFRSEVKLWNFVIGFAIAAVLDLQPIPVGGLMALTKDAAPHDAHVAQLVPLLVDLLEWGVVALSTLFGAQMWFNLLKLVLSKGASGGGAAPPAPRAAPPAPGAAPPADAAPPSGPTEPPPGPGPAPARARRKSPAGAAATGPQPAA